MKRKVYEHDFGVAPAMRHPNMCGCSECGQDNANTNIETWCMMDGVDEIAFTDYFSRDPYEELCIDCWHQMRDEFESQEADRASFPGNYVGEDDPEGTFIESVKFNKRKVREEVAAEIANSGSKVYVTKVKTSNGDVYRGQDASNLAKGITDVNKFGDPDSAAEAGNIYAAADKVAQSVAHQINKDPSKLNSDDKLKRNIATKFGRDDTESWDIQARDSKSIKDGEFLMNADNGEEKGIMTMKGSSLVQVKGNLDKKKESIRRRARKVTEGAMKDVMIDIESALSDIGVSMGDVVDIDTYEDASVVVQDILAGYGIDPNQSASVLSNELNIMCESRRSNRGSKSFKRVRESEDVGQPLQNAVAEALDNTGIVFSVIDEEDPEFGVAVQAYLHDDDVDPIATIVWDVGFFDLDSGSCEVDFTVYGAHGNVLASLVQSIDRVVECVIAEATDPGF